MENTPRAPMGCGPAPFLALITLIFLACVVPLYIYGYQDYDYIQSTARGVQDAGLLLTRAVVWGVIGGFVLVGLYGAVGVFLASAGGWNRWASPAARASHEAIELKRADHQVLPEGMSSMTITHNYNQRVPAPVALASGGQDVIEGSLAPPALPTPPDALPPGVSRLQQLVARGDVDLAGDQVLAGHNAEGVAAVLDIPAWALMIIVGQSGKGKSTLAALIAAQAALRGWDLFICDPAYHRPRSLLRQYLADMSGAVYRQAVTPLEIAHTVGLVTRIARRRIDGEPWDRHILLVIDDFSVLAGGGALDDVIDDLALVTLQCSAAGVHILLLAHDLAGSWFGGPIAKRLRGAGNIRAVLNMLPDAAKPILPSAEIARQVAVLPPGKALFFNGADAPTLITIPWLRPEDLGYAAQGRPPKPYQPFTPGALIAYTPPVAPARLAPTEPLPAPMPPRTPAPPTVRLASSVDEWIVEFLATEGGWHTADAIAKAIGANPGTLKNKLKKLADAGTVRSRGPARGPFEYASPMAAAA